MTTQLSDVEKQLIVFILDLNEGEVPELNPQTPIANSGLDSLGAVNLLFELEVHYGISIEDSDDINERMSLGTISDLAVKVKEEVDKLAQVSGSAT